MLESLPLTRVLPIVGLEVGAIGSTSLFGFGSGLTLSIWLCYYLHQNIFNLASVVRAGGFSIPPPSAILCRCTPFEMTTMKYEEFITKFNKQVFSIDKNKQLTLAIKVCKKLYLDYVEFSEKNQWGDKDVLLDAIKILEQYKTQEIKESLVDKTLKKIDAITPDMDDFGGEELASYALNTCVAVYNSLLFLLDKLPKHIYEVGICLTDTIDFKIQAHQDLTEEEIDKNPLMIEARTFLVENAK